MISRDRFDLRTSGVNLASPVVKIDYSNSFAYMGLKFLKWNHHSGCCYGLNFFIDEQEKKYPWMLDLRAISSSLHSLVEGIHGLKIKKFRIQAILIFQLRCLKSTQRC